MVPVAGLHLKFQHIDIGTQRLCHVRSPVTVGSPQSAIQSFEDFPEHFVELRCFQHLAIRFPCQS